MVSVCQQLDRPTRDAALAPLYLKQLQHPGNSHRQAWYSTRVQHSLHSSSHSFKPLELVDKHRWVRTDRQLRLARAKALPRISRVPHGHQVASMEPQVMPSLCSKDQETATAIFLCVVPQGQEEQDFREVMSPMVQVHQEGQEIFLGHTEDLEDQGHQEVREQAGRQAEEGPQDFRQDRQELSGRAGTGQADHHGSQAEASSLEVAIMGVKDHQARQEDHHLAKDRPGKTHTWQVDGAPVWGLTGNALPMRHTGSCGVRHRTFGHILPVTTRAAQPRRSMRTCGPWQRSWMVSSTLPTGRTA